MPFNAATYPYIIHFNYIIMLKIKYIIALLCLYTTALKAQNITIVDKTTFKPIEGVNIQNTKTQTGLSTDGNGKADISSFSENDSLRISFIGYKTMWTIKNKLLSNSKVMLIPVTNDLSEIVISASKFEEKKSDVAHQVEVIKAKDIEIMSQPTTAELLQQTGQVMVQKSQLGGGSPVMRGFEASRVLIVVDGVRMNNAIFRAGHLQNVLRIDNNNLERAELVFGPGSVIYGSDALGGVMHFYTKDPILSSGKFLPKGNAFIRYGSAMNEMTGHIDFSLAGKKFGSFTSVTFSDFGDLHQGNNYAPELKGTWDRSFYVKRVDGKDSVFKNTNTNKQTLSSYHQYDIIQKFVFRQSDKVKHTLNFQYSNTGNVNRYDRLTEVAANGLPRFSEWYYGPEKRAMLSYKLDLTGKTAMYDQARLIIAYQNFEESRHSRNFNGANRTSRFENVSVTSLNFDLSKEIKSHEIRYGIEATYNNVISSAFRYNVNTEVSTPGSTRYPSGGSQMYSAAAYITHAWEINEKLILSEGVRLSYVGLRSKFTDSTFFKFPYNEASQNNLAANGNISLVYSPGNDWRISALGSTGFRSPNVDDLSKVFDSQKGLVIVPNPNIKPEYTINGELTVNKTFAKRVTLTATGFYTYFLNAIQVSDFQFNGQDSIVYDGVLSRVKANTNKGRAFITGAYFGLNADVTDKFSINSSLTYTYGRVTSDTVQTPLDHIAPLFGRTALILNLKKVRSEFYMLYSAAKLLKDYSTSGEDNLQYATPNGMPGWVTLNVRLMYSVNKYAAIQVALENILDQRYRVFASGISSPGRNLVITLRGRF